MLKKLVNEKDLNLLPRCRFFLALGVTLSIAIKKTLSGMDHLKKNLDIMEFIEKNLLFGYPFKKQ